MIRKFLILFLLTTSQLGFSQPWFKRIDSLKVSILGKQLLYPWAGGFNNPQFSEIDLNLDGIKDLFVFDRTGNKITTFINKGTANTVDYQLASEYVSRFPRLHDWALLADYNCDGKADIWAYSDSGGGIDVYKNVSTLATGLMFTLADAQLRSQYYPTLSFNLYVSVVDIPAISDIDNDGDLDVISYDNVSPSFTYHQNLSIENFGTCDSLKFQASNFCWGNFSASNYDNTVTFNTSCKMAPYNPEVKPQHSGSCHLCVDLNGDNAKDMIIGAISSNSLTMVINGGNASSANMVSREYNFPQNSVPVDMPLFPCGFIFDVDNDGLKDMLVSPNAQNVSENFTGIWRYKNTGNAAGTVFTFQQNDFLQSDMIEVGEGAYPVFFDYNADGLQDLLVSNYRYYSVSATTSKISLYQNVGTSSDPKFDLITRDFNNLNNTGIVNMMPTFGDLDNDGDADMMVGDFDGNLYYFTNTAGMGKMVNYVLSVIKYRDNTNAVIDVGHFAAPQLIDVDRDGRLDIIIGNKSGKVVYYQNTGTPTIPVFTKTSAALGNISTVRTLLGYSTPFMFEQGGSYKMLVGSESGYVYFYDNIDGNISGNFTLVDSSYQQIHEGLRIALHGSDINNDGLLDLVIGNYAGGVSFYSGQSTNSIEEISASVFFDLYPNPANDAVMIRLAENKFISHSIQVNVYDMLGQKVKSMQFAGATGQLTVNEIPNGMYMCEVIALDNRDGYHRSVKKILISH